LPDRSIPAAPWWRRSPLAAVLATLASIACFGATAAPVSAMSVGLHSSTLTENPAEWEAIGKSGASWYRMNATWAVIQSAGASIGADWKNEYAWTSTYDRYFRLAAKQGITVLPVLNGRKVWGIHHNRFYGEWEPEWSEWFQFVWTFVQRYGHNGTFWAQNPGLPYRPASVWEIWNEPNLAANNPVLNSSQCNQGWAYNPEALTCVQPRNYAKFMVATITTIHNAQKEKSATAPAILTGGLYREQSINPNTVEHFFESIAENATLNAQFKASFHALSLHPYSFDGDINEKLQGMKNGVLAGHSALQSHYGNKGIWITEMGWPIGGSGKTLVSEPEQAELLRHSFDWLKSVSTVYNITLASWYFYRDIAEPSWAYHTGLRREDGSYRPSWAEFQKQTGAAAWPKPPHLHGILMNKSASGKTEVHILGAASNYSSAIGSYASALHETFPLNWQFSVNDYNQDGWGDVFSVAMSGTATKKTQLHILDGASGYSAFSLHAATALHETSPSEWQLAVSDVDYDGKADLVAVRLKNSATKKTEVHVLDGSTNYSTYTAHGITPLGESDPSQWSFSPIDYNRDGKVDVMAVKFKETASGKAEVTIIDGASGYTTTIGPFITAFSEASASQSQLWGVDYNGDDRGDLMAVQRTGTATKKTEVHVLDGKSNYGTALLHGVTPWGETNASSWWFAPSLR
jgi:hypothetical protein